MNCKEDNAEYASMRMLAVSNAKILRVGGAYGLIFDNVAVIQVYQY